MVIEDFGSIKTPPSRLQAAATPVNGPWSIMPYPQALRLGTKCTELGDVARAACGKKDIGLPFVAKQDLNGFSCGPVLC